MEKKELNDLEFNRYGIIGMLFIVVGCLSGIAVGLGAMNSVAQLIMLVIPAMTVLSLILAVGPMKYIVRASVVSGAVSVLIMVYNIFLV